MADLLALDTSVLVDFLRKSQSARDFLMPLIAKRVAAVHPIAAAELVDGVLDRRDLQETTGFLSGLRRLAVRSADLDRCLALQAELRLSYGIRWPDCLIAATCIRLDLPLVTLNHKHFKPIRGLKVIRPY